MNVNEEILKEILTKLRELKQENEELRKILIDIRGLLRYGNNGYKNGG